MTVLRVESVTKAYGELLAVNDVTMTVEPGERRALIGPNGAGKTTLFDMIGGRTAPTRGRIFFAGEDITASSEQRRARLGIAKTFQHSNLFDGLAAVENVAIAVQRQAGLAGRAWRRAARLDHVTDRSMQLLARVGLAAKRQAVAGALSHGERRQLEIAVALAIEPSLILLDEPVAGMSPAETAAFVAMVQALPPEITVLVIEHDMDVVFALATRITVLHAGEVLIDGTAAQVRSSAEVQEAYLGTGHDEDLFVV